MVSEASLGGGGVGGGHASGILKATQLPGGQEW